MLLDTESETSIAIAILVDPTKCTQQTVKVKWDVITYPSAIVDLEIDGWERKITFALVPNVPIDVVLDHCPTVNSLRARRRRHWNRPQRSSSGPEGTMRSKFGTAATTSLAPKLLRDSKGAKSTMSLVMDRSFLTH